LEAHFLLGSEAGSKWDLLSIVKGKEAEHHILHRFYYREAVQDASNAKPY
jgi:hypothetical protein